MKTKIINTITLLSLASALNSNAAILANMDGTATGTTSSYLNVSVGGTYGTLGGGTDHNYYALTPTTANDGAPSTSVSNTITFTATGLSATESITLNDIEFAYGLYAMAAGYDAAMNLYVDSGSGYGSAIASGGVGNTGVKTATTSYTLNNGDSLTFGFAFSDTAGGTTGRAHLIDDFVLNGTVNLDTVPEPTSAGLLGIGGLALLARRKR